MFATGPRAVVSQFELRHYPKGRRLYNRLARGYEDILNLVEIGE